MSYLDLVLDFELPALDPLETGCILWTPPTPDRAKGSSVDEERRRRRLISNRESARRSRLRRQRHLEKLQCEADRIAVQNLELADRLAALRYYAALFRQGNAQLFSESATLLRRLEEIFRGLHLPLVRIEKTTAVTAVVGGAGGWKRQD